MTASTAAPPPDLLLTHGYFLEEDPKERLIMKPYVPLGLLYLAAYLERAGFAVEVFDTTFRRFADLEERLRQGPPSTVGFASNLMTRANVVRLARVAKEAGWTVVLGGPEPPGWPEEYLAAGADVIVEGEGEETLEELLPLLRAQGPDPAALAKVNGLLFRDAGGALVRTSPRAKVADLDSFPWPARGKVDVGRYLETWRKAHGAGSLSVITARGCPFRCNWCSHGVYGWSHRRRRPEAVADEVAWLVETYRPEQLWYADDVFNMKPSWLVEYAEELERRGIRVPFECICRADRMTEEAAAALARLGAFRVWIGSESGSQRILDAMERGVTVEQVKSATALLKKHGIETGMFLMWGYEGEELADIEATVDLVKDSAPDVFFTTVAYPIKGTKYFEKVADRAVATTPWATGSDRDFAVRGRHSRRYYDAATKYLRSSVELHRLRRERGLSRLPRLARAFLDSRRARARLVRCAAEVEA